MGDLLSPVQTTRKVKSSTEKFELLSANNGARAPAEVTQASSVSRNGESKHSNHKKQDSTAFLKQLYLHNDYPSEMLPEDARDLLKGQPDDEDFFAVLRYLQFGIEGKHNFNIRASGPKASQILSVFVTVIIPDRWASLNTNPITREDKEAKSIILSCLTCMSGLGALHAQIKRLTGLAMSTRTAQSLMLEDAIAVLSDVLYPPSAVQTFLDDTLKLHSKPAQRSVLWQEFCSFVAGGKVLSAVAEALPLANEYKTTAGWLGDGALYTKWLAGNICHAATKVAVAEDETWSMLSQLLRRGLSLGHCGKSTPLALGEGRVIVAYSINGP